MSFKKISFAFLIAFSVVSIFLRILTPGVREISFYYSKVCINTDKAGSNNHTLSITVVGCNKKDFEGQYSENHTKIESTDDLVQQLTPIPFVNSIRFKMNVINQSWSRLSAGTKSKSAPATISCEHNGQEIDIKQGGEFPSYSIRDQFLRPSELADQYDAIRREIIEHCNFQGSINYVVQVRSATSTEPINQDALFAVEPGGERDLDVAFSESYKVKLYATFRTYVILTLALTVFILVSNFVRKFKENIGARK